MATIGEQIREARKAKGMTQEVLAMQLNLTRQAVSHWEAGRTMPDAEMLLRLSGLLDRQFERNESPCIPEAFPEIHSEAMPVAATPFTETHTADSLLREQQKNRVLWIVLISVLLMVCLLLLAFFLRYHKSSDIHMQILESRVHLQESTQALGDQPGWEFTLSVENHSDVPFTPDRISMLLYEDERITNKTFINYSDLLPWMDSDKLRRDESPLHWLFSISEREASHVVLILKGRDDNGHELEHRITVPLHHTYN